MTHGVTADLLEALREGRVDVVVSRIPEGYEEHGLLIEELYASDMAIVARNGHPKSAAQTVKDLLDCDWLVVGDPTRDFHQDASITELFVARGLPPPRSASISQSLFSAISILIHSDYVARLPRSILNHPMTKSLLYELPVMDLHSTFIVGLVRRRGLMPSAELQMLIAMLTSYARVTRLARASHSAFVG
jgi:DNA-binding transcriptional LysR family regulator